LADGTQFPWASFGLQVYDDPTAYKLTLTALEVGYRNFFASVLAGNQRGFARAVRDSGIDRSELFICGSVISNRAAGYDGAKLLTDAGWKKNLDAFGVGDIDYLGKRRQGHTEDGVSWSDRDDDPPCLIDLIVTVAQIKSCWIIRAPTVIRFVVSGRRFKTCMSRN
jgi:hypothetical protein